MRYSKSIANLFMVLNVIDFNNYLENSCRAKFCIYRNLEIGHEIHVYNENSALMKACQKTIEPDIKKALSEMHFSPTYEYYKLFLMYHLGGWFIESDMIFYDLDLNPKKTSPLYCVYDNTFIVSFCTWEPIFIKLDPTTKFFLKKSLDTLKVFLKYRYLPKPHFEVSYQAITFDYGEPQSFFADHASKLRLNFCERLNKDMVHCGENHIIGQRMPYNAKEHLDDVLLAKQYYNTDHGKPCTEKIINYIDLLKFDNFKIMP